MKGKRGLSQMVTTILIILIVLVAIGIIWAVVGNLLTEGARSISLDRFTLDLEIVGVDINETSGLAAVKVFRNSGEGDLKSIKFIVEDDSNSDVFERNAETFKQLATRTFNLDLTESDILVLDRIHKISIAPVYIEDGSGSMDTGNEITGSIADMIEGLDFSNTTGGNESGDEDEGGDCDVDSDCGEDGWVADTKYCSGMNIMQAYSTHECLGGVSCYSDTEILVNETCQEGFYCSDGECVAESTGCNNDSDCGEDGYSGPPHCSWGDVDEVVQDYVEYSCDVGSGVCSSETTTDVLETCEGEEICEEGPEGANCFVPLECSSRIDPNCEPGEVCDLETGTCVPEEVVVVGNVRSAWPYGSGEYFDSVDLPQNDSIRLGGYSIIFPGTLESRCLNVDSFVPPQFEGGISYVKLNTAPTNISDGDSFEIWETDYICTTL